MVVVPAAKADTIPPGLVIVATPVFVLLHVPPVVASLSIVVVPAHILVVPVIGVAGFTVTTAVAEQPAAVMKVIVEVPGDTPVIIPVAAPAVATAVLLLLQVPAPAELLRVVVLPWHTVRVPNIGARAFTVKTAVAIQPAVLV